jgi:hypothetical protein
MPPIIPSDIKAGAELLCFAPREKNIIMPRGEIFVIIAMCLTGDEYVYNIYDPRHTHDNVVSGPIFVKWYDSIQFADLCNSYYLFPVNRIPEEDMMMYHLGGIDNMLL